MKKATPNQNHVPFWDEGISASYIQSCYYIYQKRWADRYSIRDSYYGPHEMRWSYSCGRKYHYTGESVDWVYLEKLYQEGRSSKILNQDFSQFSESLTKGFQRRWTQCSGLGVPFRPQRESVDWKEKGKKTLSEKELTRRDWRKKKGINRDNKKASWRRGAGKWYKSHSNKLHRSWERQNLSMCNWDVLTNDTKIKYFQDSWLWD